MTRARRHVDYETNDRAVGIEKGFTFADFLCLVAIGAFWVGVVIAWLHR